MIHFLRNRLIVKNFNKAWRENNTHNQTIPGTIFPIDIINVGSYTYGTINLKTYNELNKKDKLIIGNFVSIADGVKFILYENHQTKTVTTFPLKTTLLKSIYSDDSISKGSIIIEDEVWIGLNVTILSGVTIGQGAIIAAGAVVSKSIPPYTIAGGVPAKVIRNRFSNDIIQRLMKLKLIALPEKIILNNIELFYKEIKTTQDLDELELLYKNNTNERNS